jgi:hypothetical protein
LISLGIWPDYVKLVSPLARDECLRRLQAQTDPLDSYMSRHVPCTRPLVGVVSEEEIRVCKCIPYKNLWTFLSDRRQRYPYQTFLWATLHSDGDKTHIHCRFGMHPREFLFLAFVSVMLILFLSGVFANPAQFYDAGAETRKLWGRALIAVMALMLMCTTLYTGRYLARGERAYMLEVLEKALSAQIVSV